MNEEHFKNLNKDFSETKNLFAKIIIFGKLFYYLFQRLFSNFILREKFKKEFGGNIIFNNIDKLLLNEGGMFQQYLYKICDKFSLIKDSAILVPGVGYGKNLFQLAAFRPKIIIAFDLYDYSEEWQFLSKKILEEFGTKVSFFKGDFNVLPKNYFDFFDFIISNAVLEHVRNLEEFIISAKKFLKPSGIFYASFGPIWYGLGGDHIDWGKDKIFNHLILSNKEYQNQFKDRFKMINPDSCDGTFLVKEKLFSYLKLEDYFKIFEKSGFKKELFFAKISTKAIDFLKKYPDILIKLNLINCPQFDRFCSGAYLWMKLRQTK